MNQQDHLRTKVGLADKPFEIRFPRAEANREDHDQDEEWCEVRLDGDFRRFRFHDYAELYEVPGLYEQLFYEELKCDSPRTVCGLLAELLDKTDEDPAELRVLDVGAGNGMVGEELKSVGAGTIVGVDIIEEAAEAAERDRPEVYEDYKVLDLTDIPDDESRELSDYSFNCMTTVAALGFGDIPPEAFAAAYNLVQPGGHVAFNIKDEFVNGSDDSGFSALIRGALDDGTLALECERKYRHRLSVAGDPLNYVAMVGQKRRDL